MPKKRATLKFFNSYDEARRHFVEHGTRRMYMSRVGKLKRFKVGVKD